MERNATHDSDSKLTCKEFEGQLLLLAQLKEEKKRIFIIKYFTMILLFMNMHLLKIASDITEFQPFISSI